MIRRATSRLPDTRWGFPVDGGALERRHAGRRGIAMIIAIMVIAVMIVFTSDLILTSRVSLSMATNNRDSIKAEYMAKSGVTLANYFLTIDQAVDMFLASQGKQLAAMGIKAGDSLGDVWSVLNGIPIGGDTADMLGAAQDMFGLNSFMDSKIIDQLKALDGSFTLNVEDESGKININYCAKGRCTEVLLMLEALFSCPAEKLFLDQKKQDPRKLAYKIKDYIDEKSDASPESGTSDESDMYLSRVPPYKVKDGALDSLEELAMVDGWDDEMSAVFSPYLTVYPFQKTASDKSRINLNTASKELLLCLFPEARGSCSEKFFQAMKTRSEDKSGLLGDGQNVASFLKDTFCASAAANEQDPSNRADWFSDRSTVFRVSVDGEVGGQIRRITAIVERQTPDVKSGVGATRILYWHMR